MDLHITRKGDLWRAQRRHFADASVGEADYLAFGPLASAPSLQVSRRREYWSEHGFWSEHGLTFTPSALWTPEFFHLLEDVTRVCIWCSRSLNDQLLLCAAMERLRQHKFPRKNIDVLLVEKHPDGKPINTLGYLSESYDFGSHRRTISAKEAAELLDLWSQITARDPRGLLRWVRERGTASSLGESIPLLIGHFPSLSSGLNVWQERLLKSVAENGPRMNSVVGDVMEKYKQVLDVPPDYVLHGLVVMLGQRGCCHPLVDTPHERRQMRFIRVSLTSYGEDILAGRANQIDFNGIDAWVGGIHLSSAKKSVWMRDGDTLVPYYGKGG